MNKENIVFLILFATGTITAKYIFDINGGIMTSAIIGGFSGGLGYLITIAIENINNKYKHRNIASKIVNESDNEKKKELLSEYITESIKKPKFKFKIRNFGNKLSLFIFIFLIIITFSLFIYPTPYHYSMYLGKYPIKYNWILNNTQILYNGKWKNYNNN